MKERYPMFHCVKLVMDFPTCNTSLGCYSVPGDVLSSSFVFAGGDECIPYRWLVVPGIHLVRELSPGTNP